MRPAPEWLLAFVVTLAGCEREQREFQPDPAKVALPGAVDITPGTSTPDAETASPYDGNAYGIAQGKRLFRWYNCNGCHANGGGFGPPLMDDKWIYGHQPQNIFATIVEGRPNGMPSFRGRIPDDQVWQLVAYVRSMSGLVPMDAAPGRNDSIHPVEPELRRDPLEPKPAGVAGPR